MLRLDLRTGQERGTIKGAASGMQSAFGSIWIASTDAGAVLRVDPSTGAVRATIALPPTVGAPSGLAATPTALWVTGTGVLFRIDPASNTLTTTISLEGTAYGPVAQGSTVWLVAGNDLQSPQVRPAALLQVRDDGTFAHRYALPAGAIDGGLAIAGGRLWLLDFNAPRLTIVPLSG